MKLRAGSRAISFSRAAGKQPTGEAGNRGIAGSMRRGEPALRRIPAASWLVTKATISRTMTVTTSVDPVHPEGVDRAGEEKIVGESRSDPGEPAPGRDPTMPPQQGLPADRPCRPAPCPSEAQSTGRSASRLPPSQANRRSARSPSAMDAGARSPSAARVHPSSPWQLDRSCVEAASIGERPNCRVRDCPTAIFPHGIFTAAQRTSLRWMQSPP